MKNTNANCLVFDEFRFEIMLENSVIVTRIKNLAEQINSEYAGETVHIVVVLKGAFVFASELIRHLNIAFKLDFLSIASYNGMTQGNLELGMNTLKETKGKYVLLVEDIVDSGVTADFLANYFQEKAVLDLKIASLLFKPNNFKGINKPDYVGFSINNEFVIGYGLDYNQDARGLSHIYQKTHE